MMMMTLLIDSMAKKRLNSDDLGAKGEAFFDLICADARLVSNPSIRDRTGWDRIVEFSHEGTEQNLSMDRRRAPISCHVQVKAISNGVRSVRLRLSSAERLAKEPKPAFIYIPIYGDDLKPISARLIHLSDAPLAKILARLRKEHKSAGGPTKINFKYIYLHISLGAEIPLTGAGFKAALETAVGGPFALLDYMERKKKLLATLGFGDGAYKGKITIHAGNMDEIVEWSLGLRSVDFSNFSHTETRFDIELPLPVPSGKGGQINLASTTPLRSRLICRMQSKEAPTILDGEVRVPAIPGLPEEYRRVLFRHALIDLTATCSQPPRFTFKSNGLKWNTAKVPPREWRDVLRVLRGFANPGTFFQLLAEGYPAIEFRTEALDGPIDLREVDYFETLAERFYRVATLVGLDTIEVSWAEMLESRSDVAECLNFVDGCIQNEFLTIRTKPVARLPSVESVANYFNVFRMGTRVIGYSVVARVVAQEEQGQVIWKLMFKAFGEISSLTDGEGDYARFKEGVIKRSGIADHVIDISRRIGGGQIGSEAEENISIPLLTANTGAD